MPTLETRVLSCPSCLNDRGGVGIDRWPVERVAMGSWGGAALGGWRGSGCVSAMGYVLASTRRREAEAQGVARSTLMGAVLILKQRGERQIRVPAFSDIV